MTLRNTCAILALAVLSVLGCASRRTFEVANADLFDLDGAPLYFVVLNSSTEEIDYGYRWDALDYEKYAKVRVFRYARPQVPTEIVKYLQKRGKQARLGPSNQAPTSGAIIFAYEELWGWDMRDIIKALTIRAYPSEQPSSVIRVRFEELTIFNTQPVASSLVPQMMDKLFAPAPGPGPSGVSQP